MIRQLFKKLSFLLLLCFSGALLSCPGETGAPAEITFWAMGAEGEHVRELMPAFEAENPDIRVKTQMVPWTAAQEKLITAYASDNTPDIFQLGNTWIPQFVALKAIENLDSLIGRSGTVRPANYFAGIWQTNIIDGSVYGIPWYIDTRVLFYRTDVLKAAGYDHPPRSWQELYEACKSIKRRYANEEKYAIYLPTNEWAPFVIFGLQAGSKLLKDNNSYGNFSGPKFRKAFDFLIRFHREQLAPIGISQVTNVYQAFADKYFSMYISGPWNVNEFKRYMTGDLKDKWMTAPLPGPGGRYPGVSLAGGASLVIASRSGYKPQVWKLIEYLSRPEIQIRFYRLVSDLPAVKAAWEDSTLKNDPYMQAFYTQFHHVEATPKIPEWEQVAFAKIQQYAEFAARGVMSTDEALKKLDQDVNQILEKRRWLLARKAEKDAAR